MIIDAEVAEDAIGASNNIGAGARASATWVSTANDSISHGSFLHSRDGTAGGGAVSKGDSYLVAGIEDVVMLESRRFGLGVVRSGSKRHGDVCESSR